MVVAFLAIFSQIGVIVLLISPERIELESCACAQIEAHKERNRLLHPDDAGDMSERGINAVNLISDGGDLFLPHFGQRTRRGRCPIGRGRNSVRTCVCTYVLPPLTQTQAPWRLAQASLRLAWEPLRLAWASLRLAWASTISDQFCRISPSLMNP